MTRMCTGCDSKEALVRFETEAFTIEHASMTAAIEGLSGWWCAACGEVEFDNESARRYAAAGDELVLAARMRQALLKTPGP